MTHSHAGLARRVAAEHAAITHGPCQCSLCILARAIVEMVDANAAADALPDTVTMGEWKVTLARARVAWDALVALAGTKP